MKNSILEFISDKILVEKTINEKRIYLMNDLPKENGRVIYVISREFRFYDNFALDYAKNFDIEIVFFKPIFEVKNKTDFFEKNYTEVKNDFKKNGLHYKEFSNKKLLEEYLNNAKIAFVITDFNPLITFNLNKRMIEIDGHNIVPARYVSDKQEYGARTLRGKIYHLIYEFLTEYPNPSTKSFEPLDYFIENNLENYLKEKNDPTKPATSKLSAYLNWGFVSSQRVALTIMKSATTIENKEAYLEELIIRKELADNFCLYCKDYKALSCIPEWAKTTLNNHKNDFRPAILTNNELEYSKTPDRLWNAAQSQLVKEGRIEGYLRMYWAKQLLHWTEDAQTALRVATYLNDKYGCDAPSANGYVGILWAIGGLHDRAFKERAISGKIRPMTYNGAKSKFDIENYIKTKSND